MLTVILALCGGISAGEADAETEGFIKKLSSEDFDEREKAAAELGKRAEKIWPRLEELSKSELPDVRTLARRAMCEAGKRALVPYVASLEQKIADNEKSLKDAYAEIGELQHKHTEAVEAAKGVIEKRIIDPTDENKNAEKAAEDLKVSLMQRYEAAREAYGKNERAWRLERNKLDTRLAQLKQFMALQMPILPSEIPTWEPKKLPFAERLNSKVSFEFVDTPLADALAWLSEVSGAKFELDEKVAAAGVPSINLRVTDMQITLATEWIARLADLDVSIDYENKKVLMQKAKSLK
jgi:hypothetical protein